MIFFSATAVFGISKDFYFCNIISWWQWEKWDTILRLNFLCLKWYCKISQKIRLCGKIKDMHTCRIFHVLFKLYINSHGIFLVNIVTVKINEVLRMGWKMHLGVVILNLPILKSSIHVYHTLLSSSNLKLCHLIKIRSLTHWWIFALIYAFLYSLVVLPRAVWDCMECCVHINEPGRNSGPNRHHPAGYKAGLEVLHPNRRYWLW